jgi:hypothetical protein
MRQMLLTVAAVGMFSYGTYEMVWAAVDLFQGPRLEVWAELGLIFFGLMLVLAAAFVRTRLPGGLAFAIGALLGLQALAVHDAVHLGNGIAPQIGRGALAVSLVVLAFAGSVTDAQTSLEPRAPGSDRTTT